MAGINVMSAIYLQMTLVYETKMYGDYLTLQ